MSGLSSTQAASERNDDPIVYAAAARAHKASQRRLSTIAEGEFDQYVGKHESGSTLKPGAVIREYVPKKPKKYPIWNMDGGDYSGMMEHRREYGAEDI